MPESKLLKSAFALLAKTRFIHMIPQMPRFPQLGLVLYLCPFSPSLSLEDARLGIATRTLIIWEYIVERTNLIKMFGVT